MNTTRLYQLTILIFSFFPLMQMTIGCGQGGTSERQASVSLENTFQRQSHFAAGMPETEPMVSAVKADWAQVGLVTDSSAMGSADNQAKARFWDFKLKWKKPNEGTAVPRSTGDIKDEAKKETGQKNAAMARVPGTERLVPVRDFTSVWVHIFPVFNTRKALADFPRRMPNDPYLTTKDTGSLRIQAVDGFTVASMKDGSILAEGREIYFYLNSPSKKEVMVIDQKNYPLTDVYVAPKKNTPAEVFWDKTSFTYRGGFVVTRETSPSNKPCLRAVNVVGIEDYLKAVVPAEMPSTYPIEALKAQSVAARTYALYRTLFNRCDMDHHTQQCRKETPAAFDVFANTQDQLYIGVAKESERTDLAVDKTLGVVSTYNGEIIQAFFHANSGGRTCSYQDCYGGQKVAYLQSVSEPDAEAVRNVSGGRNIQNISVKTFTEALKSCGVKMGPDEDLRLVFTKHNASERVTEAQVKTPKETVVLTAEDVKCVRLWLEIPSAYFEKAVANANGNMTITSLGFGHGVGLSQEGARVQASRGQGYENIITFYYRNVKLVDLRNL